MCGVTHYSGILLGWNETLLILVVCLFVCCFCLFVCFNADNENWFGPMAPSVVDSGSLFRRLGETPGCSTARMKRLLEALAPFAFSCLFST